MTMTMTMAISNPLLFFFFILFTLLNSSPLVRSDAIKFDLIHRRLLDSPRGRECAGTGAAPSGELPMSSAADFGTGQFLVQFRVGSPPQKFVLVMDTGSDLTWMNCNYGCRGRPGSKCLSSNSSGPAFLADQSSTFRTLPCSSQQCKVDLSTLFSITRCPAPSAPCAYDYRYADGSNALGIFANENATFQLTDGSSTTIDNVLIGCTQSSNKSFEGAEGVMGLGYSNQSLAVKAANQFGGKFSYCLVDHLSPQNVSSYLTFGDHKPAPIEKLTYTKLALGVLPPFYTVTLTGISVGPTMLNIPPNTWNLDLDGGMIIDSGSSLTTLTTPAYEPVMAALTAPLGKLERVTGDDTAPFEFCFNSTKGYDKKMVPKLTFHFEDGARFEPHAKSYVVDVGVGYKCLGFVKGEWPGPSLIGNIMQQNYFWEFDIGKGRLGFAPSGCTAAP